MKSDIEIAQAAKMQRIIDLAKEQYDIPSEHLDPYGHYKAKLSLEYIESLNSKPDGKLILVTAISPTPAGEGKTTTTIGLADALNYIGKKSISCTREPSLGPVFGTKGGAAGGGMAQVVPMEDINLHFTGDFHAITAANNLLAAMIDNHIQQGNELNIDPRLITFKRVLDMNDRSLRKITIGLGGTANGFVREDGFDIVVASEVMAILCLATSVKDLKERLGRIVIGQTNAPVKDRKYITAKDLKADGAMTALLKEALKPNVVQSLENNVCLIHGGPFANIAHGCNTYMATKASLKLAEYTVTEAGFGADLGAEKFIDIKCQLTGLRPQAVCMVATVKALKHHGGADAAGYKVENLDLLKKGLCNMDKHIDNIRQHYNLPVVISCNHFYHDTEAELKLVMDHLAAKNVPAVIGKHWAEGGKGLEAGAKAVIAAIGSAAPSPLTTVYPPDIPLLDKVKAVATKIYGADNVTVPDNIKNRLDKWTKEYPGAPVCIAKTQNSFSQDATKRGAPTGHTLEIRDARFSAGAGFAVVICGDMMTMPGLPKIPAAEAIDVNEDGKIVGLF
jgi:formate--tetrahydrofolate ligase|mmetsp:Transcript_18528/g.30074  ORF Transcript_18528/g.30074 Transcript_18528/m.30074 type:complete len:563 (+) Transcript_18528:60-1748(+)|eukprot:CAMPEP_0169111312 /NCGR_PEP_ID=MMETSP1015-20121227/26996_1 /TAXON_ID=342587 /ORGANISM="Karlodinium micrum, Strain CCMP2283" /LENGTH=562 /DNA_ID=CAMNT_0009173197 /DNA_START=57 /DNA_END=1745 /DNA_ORIENTATION=-